MKTFILMIGLPGCGKSTWAEQYRRTHKNVVILSSDEIRKELTGEYQNFTMEEMVWKTLDERIASYALSEENITVIVDATNLKNKYRIHYHSVAKDYDVRWLVEIKKTWRQLLQGNKRRSKNKWVPLDAMKKLKEEYEEPTKKVLNLYDEYRRINFWFDSSFIPEKWYGIGK